MWEGEGGASHEDDVDIVVSAVSVGKMVEDVGVFVVVFP